MKFDLVEPNEEQAILGEEETLGQPEEELPRGVHPKLAHASRLMRARLRDDLTTLGASLGRLNETVQAAQRREAAATVVDAPPPANFRTSAFSRPDSTR